MSANVKTILIVGATSGLGEQFARRFHALGKKVVITGRRSDRLSSLKADLGGSNIESFQWDITDFENISSRATEILTAHPDINSVFFVSGIASFFSFLDASTSTDAKIIAECNTNVTAQMLLTRSFVPHLASIAAKGQPASILFMGSGLGFVPLGWCPVYCGTKAAVHSLAIALRQQVNGAADQKVKENLAVVEVVAPYVDTDLNKDVPKSSSGPQPMPLKDYIDDTMAQLDDGEKTLKEVAAGSAQWRVDLWRESFGKKMNELGMQC